jgi:hypothetical protein
MLKYYAATYWLAIIIFSYGLVTAWVQGNMVVYQLNLMFFGEAPAEYTCETKCGHTTPDFESFNLCMVTNETRLNSKCDLDFQDPHFTQKSEGTCDFVGVRYTGQCGCPNDCFGDLGYGECDQTSGQCRCAPGRSGVDCSRISCVSVDRKAETHRVCSSQGRCESVRLGEEDVDMCVCKPGYTGIDCSQHVTMPPLHAYPGQYVEDEWQERHPLFHDAAITEVHLTVLRSPTDSADTEFDRLVENAALHHHDWNKSVHVYADVAINNNRIEHPTVHRRCKVYVAGGTQQRFAKQGYRIDAGKGDFFPGSEALNVLYIKAQPTDPSHVREKMAMDLLQLMRVRRSRTAFLNMWINGVYRGVYFLIEPIDGHFVRSRWGPVPPPDGGLYEARGQGFLDHIGTDDPQAYKELMRFWVHPYKSMNEPAADFKGLANLITAINRTTDASSARLDETLDLEVFLRGLATEVVLGNRDIYSNGKNYFLARVAPPHSDTLGARRRFYFLPHDYDHVAGNQKVDDAWAFARDWLRSPERPLTATIFRFAAFRRYFAQQVFAAVQQLRNPDSLFRQRILAHVELLRPSVGLDKYQSIDRGYGNRAFDKALYQDVVGIVEEAEYHGYGSSTGLVYGVLRMIDHTCMGIHSPQVIEEMLFGANYTANPIPVLGQ